jgi:hypothetical protein
MGITPVGMGTSMTAISSPPTRDFPNVRTAGTPTLTDVRNRTARFSRYLQRWWESQLGTATYPGEWLGGRDATSIAHEFRRAAQFEVSQAAFLHRKPDAALARSLVDQLVPSPIEHDAELLTDAIVRAGQSAQRVRATTAIGAVVTVFALVLRNVLRGR